MAGGRTPSSSGAEGGVAGFAYDLPPERIAQAPAAERDGARLLVVRRETGAISHEKVLDLPDLLDPGDLLVVNRSRVIPARLRARRASGGRVELLLLAKEADDAGGPVWKALARPARRLQAGERLGIEDAEGSVEVQIERNEEGAVAVRFAAGTDVVALATRFGETPLPPYIRRPEGATEEDRERYQTVFARQRGSVAAPTAGLHFTDRMLEALQHRGVERTEVTLHIGYGTFKPVRSERVEDHVVDPEAFSVSSDAAAALTRAKREGRRIIAVGTTTARALESLAVGKDGRVGELKGVARIFIHPGHPFRLVSGLITNCHLPRSSLLMLVAALAGREKVLAAYREAIERRYRFYSYGDAMLIV